MSRVASPVRMALAVCAAVLLFGSAPASAEPQSPTSLAAELPQRPEGYEIGPRRALRIADQHPLVRELAEETRLRATVEAEGPFLWEVGYFAGDRKELLIVVDAEDGRIEEAWDEDQVAWPMARGREGQFGHVLNSPWVWLPLSAIFLAGLTDWRRRRRIAHLDLAVLLSFGISHAFFNAAEIGISVPLHYPPLIYLLARMLWVGLRGPAEGDRLRPSLPTRALVVACVILVAFRVAINVLDSGVIDVGYAGVVGADRIADAEPIYGEGAFPDNNPTGDTYGPANYFAYVPFEQAFPWSGEWDSLPAARAAAIFFDLFAVAGLVLLGRRLGGNRTAAVLAFGWLAYPYTAFVLQSNANDSLLAALLIWSLVAFAEPLARGALLAAASLTKFAPLALGPLYLAGRGGLAARDPGALRPAAAFAAAFALAGALLLAHPAIEPGLATFWDRTFARQAGRESPFSIWGQLDLGAAHTVAKVAVVGLALGVAAFPRERSPAMVAALAAALLIAVQIVLEHWFYLYLVWFFPLLLVALTIDSPVRSRIGSASDVRS